MSRVLPGKTTLSCEANARRSSLAPGDSQPSRRGNRRREKETSALISSPGGPRRHPRYHGVYEGACACVCVRVCVTVREGYTYRPAGRVFLFLSFFLFFLNFFRVVAD